MPVVINSGALLGVDAVPIRVEVDLLRRLPTVCIVGLAASAVKESGERIRSALDAIGEELPRKRVVVNLAPADLRKDGTAFDLPIALGILAADGRLPEGSLDGVLAVGELALGGALRPVRGAMSLAVLARDEGSCLVVPRACASAAALVPGARVVAADHLSELVEWLRGRRVLPTEAGHVAARPRSGLDLAEVRGLDLARHALEVAAAGAHHLLLMGPPGCGKSMLARRLPTILPDLELSEAVETTRVLSAAGLLHDDALISERPFRAPHHSVTVAGLVGDQHLRPGEVSLAHNGVLFLDEAPEFSRAAIEVLREPLEEGRIRLSRARGTVDYPAAITLVMACNPCPCGLRGTGRCSCTDGDVHRYLGRLSGPILDRIDLYVELSPVPAQRLLDGPHGETSAAVRWRVAQARDRQRGRGQSGPNARLSAAELDRFAPIGEAARNLLAEGADRNGLTSRGTARVRRVARTLADLDGADDIGEEHLFAALTFRPPASLA